MRQTYIESSHSLALIIARGSSNSDGSDQTDLWGYITGDVTRPVPVDTNSVTAENGSKWPNGL